MTFFEVTLKCPMPPIPKRREGSPNRWWIAQSKLRLTAAAREEELEELRRRAERYEREALDALERGSLIDATVAASRVIFIRTVETERRVINAAEAEQFHWRGNLQAFIEAIGRRLVRKAKAD